MIYTVKTSIETAWSRDIQYVSHIVVSILCIDAYRSIHDMKKLIVMLIMLQIIRC